MKFRLMLLLATVAYFSVSTDAAFTRVTPLTIDPPNSEGFSRVVFLVRGPGEDDLRVEKVFSDETDAQIKEWARGLVTVADRRKNLRSILKEGVDIDLTPVTRPARESNRDAWLLNIKKVERLSKVLGASGQFDADFKALSGSIVSQYNGLPNATERQFYFDGL